MASTEIEIGPPAVDSGHAGTDRVALPLADSYAYCKALAKRTAGNFYFSFLTLRRERFRAMCALYGFMRVCDDLGDEPGIDVETKAAKLRSWREGLARALHGDCGGHEVFPALRDVVERYAIPAEYLHAVIDGVESDLRPRSFETFDELLRYCYQVAGAVGLCCVHIWGFRGERAIPLAIDCGTALQLTNILRDLGEDAAMGRVYLPREDLARFGVTAADLAIHRRDDRFIELMRFEVARARTYYANARELFGFLERPGRPILAAMLRIYGGLLDEIERSGYDVFTRRVSLSRGRKLRIALRAMVWYRVFGR
jgi:15-cis-phytoene synthase